jgi:N-acetylglucosamine-6-phosphate deacetylase
MKDLHPTLAITASHLFDGNNWLSGHAVLLAGDQIHSVVAADKIPQSLDRMDLGEGTLAPGLIDIQVNGGGGVMLNNSPTAEGVKAIAAAHRQVGTTGILPTLISDTAETWRASVTAVSEARASGEAGVLGLHLEGPFFEMERRGTHKADMIRPMDADDLKWLCSLHDFPVMLTLAPEHISPGDLRRLADAGLLLCTGHSNADYACIRSAVADGVQGFTHLLNAMSPMTAREPGVVGAALDSPETWASIIADGHHVHPANIRMAQRLKPGKLLLVSDAMSTVGSSDTGFEIYGERIEERDGRLVNAQGKLAGSAIALIDAVRIAHEVAGIELGECLRMASLYPATVLKLEHHLGRLQPGYRADMLFFTKKYTVTESWVAGVKS